MKIKFITEEGLLKAKNNFKTIYKDMLVKPQKSIQELFEDEKIIRDTSMEIEEFSLDMSSDNPVSTDVENIRRVYNHMKGLTESQASDERIWVAYTLSEHIDYMRYRWMPKSSEDKADRFFFNNTSKRSLFRNGIARLWWIGYHTYDASRVDPYELTAFVCRDQDFINNVLDIGFASNATITKAVLAALFDAEKAGIKIDRDLVRSISQYVNLLGGIYVLDCLTFDEIYQKLKTKLAF